MDQSAATIVIFGASGDLTSRKLIPALFDNFRKQRLAPETRILGVARTPMTDDEFREKLYSTTCEELGADCGEDCWRQFASSIHYHAGDVSQASDYARLEETLRGIEGSGPAGRLYYLALAPQLYAPLVEQLGAAGMASQERGWRRIILEKPFGQDLPSAQALNQKIQGVFRESQVYRIDHYLGKETVQNLLVLRFANSIFEPVWNRNYVDHVQITVAETVRVGARGKYYDTAGVLRDMFQNHLLQVLAMVTMEPPSRFEAKTLRDEKVKILDAIRVPSAAEVEAYSVLGQYEGYRSEPDVNANSQTPTYAAVRLDIDNWRWQGVPFYLRSGKALAAKTTEVIIQFRCPPHMIFQIPQGERLRSNQLVITIQPDEGIHLSFQTKAPDSDMTLRESKLYFHYHDSYPITPIPESYERLLLDALDGDASLFIRKDEIELAWELIDPIIAGWSARGASPLHSYLSDSWGPVEADAFIAREGRSWVNGASLHHDG